MIKKLEKKAKVGWASFFRCQNDNHEIHIKYMNKINALQDNINDFSTKKNAPRIPVYILNELVELYDIAKKEVECPICLEIIPTDKIKFSSCGHKYCEVCLNTLKSQNPKCAICRRRIY